ncbi:Uncharacterized protein Adt_21590 [Abeliophyllum distichum]|uniref:Uncharacterized protein n=1 Tax=Abeliophyllum distichum TaxID=126358 RepID=A0ABD1SZV7_9LAMI
MSLIEYEHKFEELSRFAPHLVDTKSKRARRFEHGLQPHIRNIVAVLELGTYQEVLKRAHTISNQMTQNTGNSQQGQNYSSKRKWNFDKKKGSKGNNRVKKRKVDVNKVGNKCCPNCNRSTKENAYLGKTFVSSVANQDILLRSALRVQYRRLEMTRKERQGFLP